MLRCSQAYVKINAGITDLDCTFLVGEHRDRIGITIGRYIVNYDTK